MIRRYFIKLLGILFSTILLGCSYSPKEYMAWIQDPSNGLRKRVDHQGFTVEIQYKPTDYMFLTNPGADISDREALDSIQYYNLSLQVSKEFCQQMETNSKLRDYLSYGFQNDIYIQQGNDSLPCVLFHYERTLSMKCVASYILGFKKSKGEEDKKRCMYITPTFFSSPLQVCFSDIELPNVDI